MVDDVASAVEVKIYELQARAVAAVCGMLIREDLFDQHANGFAKGSLRMNRAQYGLLQKLALNEPGLRNRLAYVKDDGRHVLTIDGYQILVDDTAHMPYRVAKET